MNNPNYYAILPADVRYDKTLKPMEKILYAEITALAQTNGYCYAQNSYFAELYDTHKNTVGNWINNLVKKGYIFSEIIYKEGSKEIEKRLLTPINKKVDTPQRKDGEGINKKIDTPINENVEDNITSLEYYKSNKKSKPKKDSLTEKLIDELIEKHKLPRHTDLEYFVFWFIEHRKNIKHPIKTIKPLTLFLSEVAKAEALGFSLDDIKHSIETKEWRGFEAQWLVNQQRGGGASPPQSRRQNNSDVVDKLFGSQGSTPEDSIVTEVIGG